jgi:hypothetical protein
MKKVTQSGVKESSKRESIEAPEFREYMTMDRENATARQSLQ